MSSLTRTVVRTCLGTRPRLVALRRFNHTTSPNTTAATASLPLPATIPSPTNHLASGTTAALDSTSRILRNTKHAKWLTAAALSILGTTYFLSGDDGKDDPVLGRPNPADVNALSRVPTSKLISGWIVYAFCSSPLLVNISEPLFKYTRSIPGLGLLVDGFARKTFFRQFFGEETAEAAEKTVWTPLRRERVGVLTAYNVEAETYECCNSPELIEECVAGTLDALRSVGKFGVANSSPTAVEHGDTACWLCTKVTGLVPEPMGLVRAAEYVVARRKENRDVTWPGLPEDGDFERLMGTDTDGALSTHDRKIVRDLYNNLRLFAQEAQKYGVRVNIDAEQSWYQPVVDVLTEELMREFNNHQTGPPVICASFQAYLRRNAQMIESQLQRAASGGYTLMFKQVRGAYMPYERARWAELGKPGPPPVWASKAETDASYDAGMKRALEAIKARKEDVAAPDVAVMFATHNEVSVDNAMAYVADMGLGSAQADGSLLVDVFIGERLAFAQIYGMKDGLTNRIASSIKTPSGAPVVCKYAVYGTLEHALPNLSRRAAENKTVMDGRGGAVVERKRLGRELCRRFVPFYESER